MNHLAIIADGNRRWAKLNNLPIELGYAQGLTVIERCCDWAIKNQLKQLTVYVFSTENWDRPQEQIDFIMNLARFYFKDKKDWFISREIKVSFRGRRDRFAKDIVEDMFIIEQATKDGQKLNITLCADYGGKNEIERAILSGARTEKEIDNYINSLSYPVDAILRTGGEKRLSNFLLWQSAYAELFFYDILFPDLDEGQLDTVLMDYDKRGKNFGK